jgi:hypothetical protein
MNNYRKSIREIMCENQSRRKVKEYLMRIHLAEDKDSLSACEDNNENSGPPNDS